jgi:hypothetical protein
VTLVIWNLILVRLEIVLVSVQDRLPWAQKPFWTLAMVLVGDEAQVHARFGPFGDSTNLNVR